MGKRSWGGSRKQEFDMAATLAEMSARLEAMDRRIGNAGNHNSRAVQLYRSGHIDGRFDFADALDTLMAMIAAFIGGACIAGGVSALTGSEFLPMLAASAGAAGAIGVGRIVVDLMAPALRTLPWIVRAWRVRDKWPQFEAWLAGDRGDAGTDRIILYRGPELVRDVPEVRDDRVRHIELADGSTMPMAELRAFLIKSFMTGDWTRSGWAGGDGKAGRGMRQNQWTAIRQTLGEMPIWGTTDRPTLDAFLARLDDT